MAHQASARRRPLVWLDDQSAWDRDAGHADEWEVICPCMGDDGGPAERQSEEVQRFRGPYATREAARAAAHQHNVETHWR